jgi:hypothetical protein
MIEHAANVTNDNKTDISRVEFLIDLEVDNHHPTEHNLQNKNHSDVR